MVLQAVALVMAFIDPHLRALRKEPLTALLHVAVEREQQLLQHWGWHQVQVALRLCRQELCVKVLQHIKMENDAPARALPPVDAFPLVPTLRFLVIRTVRCRLDAPLQK